MRLITAAVLSATLLMDGCTIVNTEPGTEAVVIDKPLLLGSGGVRAETFKPGRAYTWYSSTYRLINMQPQLAEENFDDLMSIDTVPVDFKTTLQVQITDPVRIVSQYGDHWYKNNIERQYQALVRDEARKYTMNQLLTGADVPVQMEKNIRAGIDALIKSRNLPFVVTDLSIGRAVPNKNVLDQIDLTAAQQQRSKTMVEQEHAEINRMKAEQARAAADNAYREKMSLSPDQFLQLESIKRYSESCAKGTNCTFMFGATNTSMLVPQHSK
jgi:regulator of protease activity HflC (stomatin/prohibitin superfamily)